DNRIARFVAEGKLSRRRERGRVEPLVDCLWAGVRIAHGIRPRSAADVGDIARHDSSERLAAAQRHNSIELPSAQKRIFDARDVREERTALSERKSVDAAQRVSLPGILRTRSASAAQVVDGILRECAALANVRSGTVVDALRVSIRTDKLHSVGVALLEF